MELFKFIEFNWFTLSLLFGLIVFFYKIFRVIEDYKNQISLNDTELNEKLEKSFNEIKTDLNKLNEKLDDHINKEDKLNEERAKRTKLIMNGVEATLKTLHTQGHNGPVTKSLEELNAYKLDKATKF